MSDVFLSYKREDVDDVRDIAEFLTTYNFSIDWDREILPGDNYSSWIRDRLRSCSSVVVCWSRHAAAPGANWVFLEAMHGVWEEKLIPLLLDSTPLPADFNATSAVRLHKRPIISNREEIGRLAHQVWRKSRAKPLQSSSTRDPEVAALPARLRTKQITDAIASAEAGDRGAQLYAIACAHEFGAAGIPKDVDLADALHREAAAYGHIRAKWHLGCLLEASSNVQEQYEAVAWLERASAELCLEAQFMLGRLYDKGRIVSHDAPKAIELFQSSAEHGYAPSQFYLAELLRDTGRANEAETWYIKALAQNYGHAALGLAALMKTRANPRGADVFCKLALELADSENARRLASEHLFGGAS